MAYLAVALSPSAVTALLPPGADGMLRGRGLTIKDELHCTLQYHGADATASQATARFCGQAATLRLLRVAASARVVWPSRLPRWLCCPPPRIRTSRWRSAPVRALSSAV